MAFKTTPIITLAHEKTHQNWEGFIQPKANASKVKLKV